MACEITNLQKGLPLTNIQALKNLPTFSSAKLLKILAGIHFTPLTLPNKDLQGRTLQLWKYKNTLRGTIIDAEGNVRFFSGRKIRNPCSFHDDDQILIESLESIGLRQWHLGYESNKGEIYIFPYLIAAGKDPHYVSKRIQEIKKRIPGVKKHFTTDDFNGAKRELNGEAVKYKEIDYHPFGKQNPPVGERLRPFLHFKEIQETQENCNKLVSRCEKLLRRHDLTADQRREIKTLYKEIFTLRRESYAFVPRGAQSPKGFEFKEPLQLAHLTDSYKSSNPKNPVPPRGGSGGSIGGVGNQVGIIEGLFDTAAALEEDLHYFYIPSSDGKMPFSPKELQQILRELAFGIYVHDTFPFFSLHFNSDANMYPIIHPVYEHTLVGRVISLLDFYMKGFLNGGFFDELFLQDWQKNKSHNEEFLKSKCVDIHQYCKKYLGNDVQYLSVREVVDFYTKRVHSIEKYAQKGQEVLDKYLKKQGLGEIGKLLTEQFLGKSDPEIFSNYSGFRSSFRIIAKQNSIKKSGALFELDGDFDVFYTIEPDPAYEEALQKYQYEYGYEPPGYLRLVHAYEFAKHQIRTVMPRLPLFKELFEQLKVINFFCYYLNTLKQAQKVPVFSRKALAPSLGCVPLFPHLPIRKMRSEKVDVNFGKIFQSMSLELRQKLEIYLFADGGNEEPPPAIINSVLTHFREYLLTAVKKFTVTSEKEFAEEHRTFVVQFLATQRKSIQDMKTRTLSQEEQQRFDQLFALGTILDISTFQPGDLELLLRKRLTAPKKDISELKGLKKKAQENLDVCNVVLRNMAWGLLYNKSAGEIKQEKEKITAVLHQLDEEIKGIEECQWMVSLFSLAPTPFTESKTSLEFFSEQPAEEREENRRIVGGCGLKLDNLPLTLSSLETSLVSQTVSRLVLQNDEELVPVMVEEGTKPQGHAFQLHLADFSAVGNKDYQWLSFFHERGDEQHLERIREFINSILFGDEEFFLEALPNFKNSVSDFQGVHAVHHAAAAELPTFLKALVEKGHSLSTGDPQGYLPLHYAAKAGRLDQIQYLCSQGSPLNSLSKGATTPLHLAVQHNQLAAVDLLLKLGANPNTQTTYGMSPLFSAVHNGYQEVALRLIQHPTTNVDLAVEDKSTPFFVAVECNSLVVAEALLKRGANCHLQRYDTYTPLHIAAKNGLTEMCRVLISAKTDVNAKIKSGKTALHLASQGYPEVVRELLAAGADPSLGGWDGATSLMTAIVSGNTLSAEIIIHFCADTEHFKGVLTSQDLKKKSPLMAALARRQYDIVQLLLQWGIKIPHTIQALNLMCRAKLDPVFIVQTMSEAGVSKKMWNEVCLIAQREGHNQLVCYLILFHDIKETAIKRDPNGWGLPHYAAEYDNLDVIKQVIQTSQDLVQFTKDGRSLAAIAAEHNSTRVLALLLDAMIDRKVPLENQFIQKHLLAAAVVAGHEKAADRIIHHILDPNIVLDREKTTAAHLAAKNDDVEMLSFLRSRGARFDAFDSQGKTPIHHAVDLGWKDSIDYFLDQKNEIQLPGNLLRYAAKKGSADLIDRLVKRGFKVNEAGKESNQTAVFWAITDDNLPAFEALCHHGADLSHRSSAGLTPLLLAAKLGRVRFIIQILDKLREHATGLQGETALHFAVLGGDEECVGFCLRSGFKPDAKQENGKTPLDLAKSLDLTHIQLILEGKEKILKNRKELIVQALKKGEISPQEFVSLFQGMSINAPMLFEISGKRRKIPLLHLIHEIAAEESFRNAILLAFSKIPGMDPMAKCSKGRTLYHVLAQHQRDFGQGTFDLTAQDKKRRIPLHFYVAGASADQLKSCKIDPKNVDIEDADGNTPLLVAIGNKKVDNAKILLQSGASPNHRNLKLITPLAAAVQTNHLEMIRLLLDQGAKINQTCLSQRIPVLSLAIAQKHTNMAMLLIAQGADVRQTDRKGVAPVHLAASVGDLLLLRLLQSAGANLDAVDHDGKTIAHYAAESDNPEIIDFLVAQEVPLDTPSQVKVKSVRDKKHLPQQTTAFHLASQRGNTAMMQKLVENGCNVEAETEMGLSPLACSARSNNKQALRFFRDYRIMENSEQRTEAIQMALAMDSVPSLKEFYREGASVNALIDKRGRTALHYAALLGAHQCAVFLIQRGADLSTRDLDHKLPLDLAVFGKHLRLVRYFIQQTEKPDLNADGPDRKPYLHQACEAGEVELAGVLIEFGASLETVDFQGMRPVHIAAKQTHYRLLHLLLAFGADPEAKTADNQSIQGLLPTQEAETLTEQYLRARLKRLSLKQSLIHTAVDLNDGVHLSLLCKTGDINAKDGNGQTPLHRATLAGNLSRVSQLVSLGANVDEKDSSNLTSLQLAFLQQKEIDLIEFLLKAKADVTVKDKNGNSLLYLITELPDTKYAHRLFDLVVVCLPKVERSQPSSEILTAMKEGKMATFYQLINDGHPIVNEKFSLLYLAIKDLNLPITHNLLEWVGPPRCHIDYQDSQGVSSLHLAVIQGSLKAVQMLVAKKANLELRIKEGGKTPLALAVEKSVPITACLLENGADPCTLSDQHTLLHILSDESRKLTLSKEERQAVFNMIYKRLPRSLSVISTEMDQALQQDNVEEFFHAFNKGHAALVEQICIRAASQGSLKILKILHQWFAADLEVRDEEERTLLHRAALHGHLDTLNYLLAAGAKIDVVNKMRRNILHSIFESQTLKNPREVFIAIYRKIPKKFQPFQENPSSSWDDSRCFQLFNEGYIVIDVAIMAAKANLVFTMRALYTHFPNHMNLEVLADIAEAAKADKVVKYIQSVSPSNCSIL